MREMKDSGINYIGLIPQTWKTTTTKRLFRVESGATPATDKPENFDGQITWITPADYKTNDVYVSTGRRNLSEEGLSSCSAVLVPAGSIIFSKRAPIGSVAIASKELCTNQGCLSCVPQNEVSSEFFYYCMSVLTEQYQLLGTGTTFKEISLSSFANFALPFPSFLEQSRIAAYLDRRCATIDALIANQQQQIDKLKQYKQAVITEAVTRGLDPNVRMKDSGVEWIGEVPEHWKVYKLKAIIDYIESGVSVNAGQEPAKPNEYGVLKTSSVSKYVFDVNENKSVNEGEEKRVSCPVRKDTIIVSRMNTPELVGACGYVEKDYDNIFLPDRLWQVHFHSDKVKYIWYWLRSKCVRDYYSSLSVGTSSSMQNISQDQFANAFICIPKDNEQIEIISFLDTKCARIDALIALKQQKADKLVQYKKSLIYEVVTGKREV